MHHAPFQFLCHNFIRPFLGSKGKGGAPDSTKGIFHIAQHHQVRFL